jgi:TorA specific chaperone
MTRNAQIAELWRWLAGIFAAPMNAESLRASGLVIEMFLDAPPDAALAPGLEAMRTALANLPQGTDGVAGLAHSYTLLFSGVAGRNTVAPYESAFTTATGRLFGEPDSRMRALLSDLDLRVAEGLHEPADHISVELATMGELVDAHDLDSPRQELLHALRGWLRAFRDACMTHDTRGFYAGAATLATALVDLDVSADTRVDGAVAMTHA